MSRVRDIKKQTDNKFLNMYELEAVRRDGETGSYFMASRNPDIGELKLRYKYGEKPADAVMIVAVQEGKLVLERQFRYPIDDYIYEFPAGLIEKGESVEETGVREFFEETGMKLEIVKSGAASRPFYPSVGMTDESISTVYGHAWGQPSSENQEITEDITVVLADREECRRILREENVSIMCAFMLMHYITTEPGHEFDFVF